MNKKEGEFINGTPPMLLFPPKNYFFKIKDEHYIIEIPRKGRYFDLAPDVFDEEDGEFNIYDEESKTFYLPSITKVLFAVKKYPDLESNQFFVPYVIELEDDTVNIIGQVLELLIAVKDEQDLDED